MPRVYEKNKPIDTSKKRNRYDPIKVLNDYLQENGISFLDIVTEVVEENKRLRESGLRVFGVNRKYHLPPLYYRETNERVCYSCRKKLPWTIEYFNNYTPGKLGYLCKRCYNVQQWQREKKRRVPKQRKILSQNILKKYSFEIKRFFKWIKKEKDLIRREDFLRYLFFHREIGKSDNYIRFMAGALNYYIRENLKIPVMKGEEYLVANL